MTIKDIAEKSGYGVGTVSRVLNNHPNVSDDARKKILEVAEKYHFVRNTNARLLKQHDRYIAILVKGVSNILLNSILEIIQKHIGETKYTSSVFVLDEYDNEAATALRIYYEKRPAGIIFLGGNPTRYKSDFNKIKIPCVLITNQAHYLENKKLSSVSTDDKQAAREITEYLIKCGHRKIGVIGGDITNSEISKRRYLGILSAMNENGIEFDFEKMYQTTKYSFEGGAEAAEKLIKKCNEDITAVITMSDVMAIGAMRKLNDMGYDIPKDLSIVGFDGLPFTQYVYPRLTTIRQDEKGIAELGLKSLLESIDDENNSAHNLMPFELIEGESVLNIANT